MSDTVKSSAKKAKVHTVYKNAAGKRVPGVTTITGVLDKPALVNWANNLGLEGVKVREYVDDLAGAGSAAHRLIEEFIAREIAGDNNIKLDFGEFSADQMSLAESAFIKFLSWNDLHKPRYVASELVLVSESLQVGGTIDCLCEIHGKNAIVDFKTCKAIYKDHHLQVGGGYAPIAKENGYPVDEVWILRVGRDESEGDVEFQQITNRAGFERMFKLCRDVYELRKELKM